MKVITIARNAKHSPNMSDKDEAILTAVEQLLSEQRVDVCRISENEEIPAADAVCSMSRTSSVIEKLQKAEERGITVVNPTKAIKNAERINFTRILDDAGIPQPTSIIGNSNELPDNLQYPLWIKKGDGWSNCKEDIFYAKDKPEALTAIKTMKVAGIETIIYSRHIKGDIIKFYGVGNDFFYHTYPDIRNGKFGLETINGEQSHYPFDGEKLKEIIYKAANATGLLIYGGDCIVTQEGKIFIIDINDFPSFGATRDKAATAIARLIIKETDKNRNI